MELKRRFCQPFHKTHGSTLERMRPTNRPLEWTLPQARHGPLGILSILPWRCGQHPGMFLIPQASQGTSSHVTNKKQLFPTFLESHIPNPTFLIPQACWA